MDNALSPAERKILDAVEARLNEFKDKISSREFVSYLYCPFAGRPRATNLDYFMAGTKLDSASGSAVIEHIKNRISTFKDRIVGPFSAGLYWFMRSCLWNLVPDGEDSIGHAVNNDLMRFALQMTPEQINDTPIIKNVVIEALTNRILYLIMTSFPVQPKLSGKTSKADWKDAAYAGFFLMSLLDKSTRSDCPQPKSEEQKTTITELLESVSHVLSTYGEHKYSPFGQEEEIVPQDITKITGRSYEYAVLEGMLKRFTTGYALKELDKTQVASRLDKRGDLFDYSTSKDMKESDELFVQVYLMYRILSITSSVDSLKKYIDNSKAILASDPSTAWALRTAGQILSRKDPSDDDDPKFKSVGGPTLTEKVDVAAKYMARSIVADVCIYTAHGHETEKPGGGKVPVIENIKNTPLLRVYATYSGKVSERFSECRDPDNAGLPSTWEEIDKKMAGPKPKIVNPMAPRAAKSGATRKGPPNIMTTLFDEFCQSILE